MSEKTSNYVNVEYDPPSKTGTFIYGATEWASTEQDFDQETKQVKKKLKKLLFLVSQKQVKKIMLVLLES